MRPLNQIAAESCETAEAGPPKDLENREATSDVQKVIATLPDNQQEVIRLRFQNSLSYREISKVTNLSVTNVGYLIHTAIKTIQQKLGAGPSATPRTTGGLS
jgi:RNA polymerase sigma-70 factor (ECF subfamily)